MRFNRHPIAVRCAQLDAFVVICRQSDTQLIDMISQVADHKQSAKHCLSVSQVLAMDNIKVVQKRVVAKDPPTSKKSEQLCGARGEFSR